MNLMLITIFLCLSTVPARLHYLEACDEIGNNQNIFLKILKKYFENQTRLNTPVLGSWEVDHCPGKELFQQWLRVFSRERLWSGLLWVSLQDRWDPVNSPILGVLLVIVYLGTRLKVEVQVH